MQTTTYDFDVVTGPAKPAPAAAHKPVISQQAKLDGIEPTHALAGKFTFACERGRLSGTVILSPDAEPGIQKLTFALPIE